VNEIIVVPKMLFDLARFRVDIVFGRFELVFKGLENMPQTKGYDRMRPTRWRLLKSAFVQIGPKAKKPIIQIRIKQQTIIQI
jgi:hypothetical protein